MGSVQVLEPALRTRISRLCTSLGELSKASPNGLVLCPGYTDTLSSDVHMAHSAPTFTFLLLGYPVRGLSSVHSKQNINSIFLLSSYP